MQPLRARTIIELVGKPKDFVERTFEKMRELIKQHPGLELISEDIEPVKEKKNHPTNKHGQEVVSWKTHYVTFGNARKHIEQRVDVGQQDHDQEAE